MIPLLITWLLLPLLRWRAGPAEGTPRRILVIQLAKIGDLICSTPVFHALRQQYPGVCLDAMVTPVNAVLLRNNPHVDHCIVAQAADYRGLRGKIALIRCLREGDYDTVVCLNANATFALAAIWAGIPRRLSIASNFGGRSHRLAARLWSGVELHRGDRLIQQTHLALLRQLGVRVELLDKEVFARADADVRAAQVLPVTGASLIGIGVSSANRLKALGSSRLIAIARRLLEAFPTAHIALIGAPEDKVQAAEILAHLPAGRVFDTCGQLDLAELPALLQRLSVYLGVDSGITYMADALKVPLVSVAGPCNMAETRPLGPQTHILQMTALPCVPCAHIFRAPYQCHLGTRACIETMPIDDIVNAVCALVGQAGSATQEKSHEPV